MNAALVCVNDKCYVIGGEVVDQDEKVMESHLVVDKLSCVVECWDRTTKTWSSCPPCKYPCSSVQAIAVEHKIYILGRSAWMSGSNVAECYDTLKNSWSDAPHIPPDLSYRPFVTTFRF